MNQFFLIINTGSASKKYALYDNGHEVAKFHFEKEGDSFIVTKTIKSHSSQEKIPAKIFDNSLAYLLDALASSEIITGANAIAAVAMRIVAPGLYFHENRLIDGTYIKKLKSAEEQAPLHLAPMLSELRKLLEIFPKTSIVGVSDSIFSSRMPEYARLYSLPRHIAQKYGIYRYGYHGISMQSVLGNIKKQFGKLPEKTIICHLGSGSSIAAIKNGQCVDISMGFTPLEGLVMGTRIGAIDAGAVIYLSQKTGWSSKKLETFFNTECGLKGLSGKTADMRELLELEKSGNQGAKLAVESFVYSAQKYIGAYTVALGGIDLLVFTATIGERSFIIRDKICSGLEALGIKLDQGKNNATESFAAEIGAPNSMPKIWVIPTNEMLEIYEQAHKMIM